MTLETGIRFYPCCREFAEENPCRVGEIIVSRKNPDGSLDKDFTGNFYTWDAAQSLYPNITKSGSSSVCPDCSKMLYPNFLYPHRHLIIYPRC